MKWHCFGWSVILLSHLALSHSLQRPFQTSEEECFVQLPFFNLRGSIDLIFPNVCAFLGFRFASKPNRFEPASPLQPPTTRPTLNATQYAAVCPQTQFYLTQSEDCLFMNVYTPRHVIVDEKLPVLVYLFGGGFFVGSGQEHKIYDGSFIVQNKPVIVATFNFRVGSLGFLAVDGVTPNVGLHDQIVALKFVKENIERFGGDPTRITLWGQSAGALSAAIHLFHPHSANLFHRVILQSPPLGLHFRTAKEGASLAKRLAFMVGCSILSTPQMVTCLRNVSIWKLVAARLPVTIPILGSVQHPLGDILTWAPVVDNHFIFSESLSDMFDRDSWFQGDILTGFVQDEASILAWLLPSPIQWLHDRIFQKLFPHNYHKITSTYRNPGPGRKSNEPISELLFRASTDALFSCPIRRFASIQARKRSVFMYENKFVPTYLHSLKLCEGRVCHASDIPFTWHTTSTFITMTPEEQATSNGLIDSFLEFVRMGKERTGGGGKHESVIRVRDEGSLDAVLGWKSRTVPWPSFGMGRQGMSVMEIVDGMWRVTSANGWRECEFWDTQDVYSIKSKDS